MNLSITLKDKQLVQQIAQHFKFSLGDALEVFKYAQFKSKTKNAWLKGMCKKAVPIEECREILSGVDPEVFERVMSDS